jgi:hypothetical protein
VLCFLLSLCVLYQNILTGTTEVQYCTYEFFSWIIQACLCRTFISSNPCLCRTCVFMFVCWLSNLLVFTADNFIASSTPNNTAFSSSQEHELLELLPILVHLLLVYLQDHSEALSNAAVDAPCPHPGLCCSLRPPLRSGLGDLVLQILCLRDGTWCSSILEAW